MKVFAQLTDLHTDDFLANKYKIDTRMNIRRALDAVGKRGVRDLVLTGDLGDSSAIPWLMETIRARGMKARVTLGNHDKAETFRNLKATGILLHKSDLYYAELIEGILCLFLDSGSAVIGKEQFRWIEEQTSGARGNRLVIFVHHPILDCGRTLMDRRYPLKNREVLAEYLEGLNRDVFVFCGHYHTSHVQRLERITQYVTPSLFVQFKSHAESFQVETTDISFRLIEFDGGDLRTELVEVL
jgi:3',5'-cyclic-AMP phosphodiesterase